MSDNDNGNDDGQELVTKPFKFVTGMPFRASAIYQDQANTSCHSRYATLRAPVALYTASESSHIILGMRHGILTSSGTIGFDARFPNQNQTKHCWQNYVDYHKCIIAKGEDFAPCRQVRIP